VNRRFEFCVRYRRASWGARQMRLFQSELAAYRLVDRLLSAASVDQWGAVVECSVERRAVEPWATIDVLRDEVTPC
jgi:hypothetical protein